MDSSRMRADIARLLGTRPEAMLVIAAPRALQEKAKGLDDVCWRLKFSGPPRKHSALATRLIPGTAHINRDPGERAALLA